MKRIFLILLVMALFTVSALADPLELLEDYAQEISELYDESDRALSKQMVQAFVSFCSTGDPGFAGNTAGQVYEFGEQTGLIDEPHQDLYAILDRMYGWNLW